MPYLATFQEEPSAFAYFRDGRQGYSTRIRIDKLKGSERREALPLINSYLGAFLRGNSKQRA